MRHGSLFSGILGAELALEAAGAGETAWCAEIDKFCNRVIKYRRPELPNLGDVREIDGRRIQPVDVVTLGFPCQDLSVAGRRAGLGGARSSLFFEAARIINQCRPAFAVVENVPGLFSSNGGRDFAMLLYVFRELGANDVAWRVFDSQYWGVPQQRRRIYLVADFRGRRAGEILFESEGCGGHPAPGSEAREGVAGALTSRARGLGGQLSGPRGEDDYNLTVSRAVGRHAKADRGDDVGAGLVTPAMTAKWAKGSGGPAGDETQNLTLIQDVHGTIRRFTPVECERLQGFPDGWTCLCGAEGDMWACRCADGPRYRALGNAWTTGARSPGAFIFKRMEALL